jgi:hypothetical protein
MITIKIKLIDMSLLQLPNSKIKKKGPIILKEISTFTCHILIMMLNEIYNQNCVMSNDCVKNV